MSKASKNTFFKNLENGNINSKKLQIYYFVRNNPNCTKEFIIDSLGIPHQTVTARLSELTDLGVIVIKDITNAIGKDLSQYKVQTQPFLIEESRKKRTQEKFDTWKKQGLTKFSEFLDIEILNKLKSI